MNICSAAMKVILLTGATDGIGLEAAKLLVAQGHHVLLHGRNPSKLQQVETLLSELGTGKVESFVSDLSSMSDVEAFAKAVTDKHDKLDVLINNAGVLKTPNVRTEEGLDVRFAVNTIAPYLLTKRLLPLIPKHGRVVNISSAAQSPVKLEALAGKGQLSDNEAYAQSKLAIMMWSYNMSLSHQDPVIVSVNPASLLGSKMVKEAYGIPGKDLSIGAEILRDAALSEKFEQASGKYFDNDAGEFGPPHPDAMNQKKSQEVVDAIDAILAGLGHN
jgi:NAD(P)-dependent dehydrogenase (short-subunit alcohol dehydrogenase family)